MASSSIDNNVPHYVLFLDELLSHIPPRVFGSICCVHYLTRGLDKLIARAIKCIFLGYSRNKKVIGATLLPTTAFTCLLMSPSLKIHLF